MPVSSGIAGDEENCYLCVVMDYIYRRERFLTADRCTPQNEMPLQSLVRELIELATLHANNLGVGYDRMHELGLAWVLSRLSVEMERWPQVNTSYTIETWVQNHNRRFSERDFRITDADGCTLGYARSIWMAIDEKTRAGGDLSQLTPLVEVANPIEIPMAPMSRMSAKLPDGVPADDYTFTFTDCDNNRHVTTARYVELMLNTRSMDFYDRNRVARFDIAFHHENRYGETVAVRHLAEGDALDVALTNLADGSAVSVRTRTVFADR